MAQNDQGVWAELQDLQRNERREWQARNALPGRAGRNGMGGVLGQVNGALRPMGVGRGRTGVEDTGRGVGRPNVLSMGGLPGKGLGAGAGASFRQMFRGDPPGGGAGPPRRIPMFRDVAAEFGLLAGQGDEEGEGDGVNGDGSSAGAYHQLGDDEDWGAVADLDQFFRSMYSFFASKGLYPIVVRGLANLAILAFTVVFSAFLFAFVDWGQLSTCRDEESCRDFHHYVTSKPWREPSLFHLWVWAYMLLFLLYWAWCALSFWYTVKEALEMDEVYRGRLQIDSRELQTIAWSTVVDKFLLLHNSGRYMVVIHKSDLTAHDLASRIMRKDNYFIAFINKGLLKLSLPLPFLGAKGLGTLGAHTERQFLTKSLEWSVNFCVINHMFNQKFTIRRDFLSDAASLRRRFVLVGLAHVALLPFLLLFMTIYFFLQNAQDWHSSRNYLGPRQWSPHAQWTFREFNELKHVFDKRLEGSYRHTEEYLSQFPHLALASILRTIRFVSGSFVAVLLLLTLLDDSILLYVKLWDKNLLWYVGVFSATYAFSRSAAGPEVHAPPSALPQPQLQPGRRMGMGGDGRDGSGRPTDSEEIMLRIAAHTHYMPERWWGRSHTREVRDELLGMYQYKAQLFIQELLSVLFAPVILCFALPGCAQDIIDFVENHTVDVPGTGSVCSYSQFDFGKYGDEDYAAPAPGGGRGGRGSSSW